MDSIVDLVVPQGQGAHFSGVDLDWEFPNAVTKNDTHFTGTLGLSCNEHKKTDTANYLQFIKVSNARRNELEVVTLTVWPSGNNYVGPTRQTYRPNAG